jgi:hypothetical protein
MPRVGGGRMEQRKFLCFFFFFFPICILGWVEVDRGEKKLVLGEEDKPVHG